MKRIITGAIAALLSLSALAATTIPVQSLTPTGSTAGQAIVSTGPTGLPAWGSVTATALAAQAANTVVANITASSASPTAVAIPTCNTSTSALQYTPVTGWTCYANSATTTGTLAQFATGGAINPVSTGATTPGTGSFTTLVASGGISGTGFNNLFASPPNIGLVAPAAGKFTTLQATSTLTGFTGRLLNIQVFSSTGTYTPTTGTAAVYVKVQAGGGAGGGTPTTSTGQAAAGSGGTAGAYGEGYYTSGFSGVTVTVGGGGSGVSGSAGGAGSASSFGALLSCPGGAGGAPGTANAGPWVTAASGNTSACTGTALFNQLGVQGGQSIVVSATASNAGSGAGTAFGPGPAGAWSAPAPGAAAQSYGAAGAGANAPASNAAQAGGSGKQGIVEVFEFSQ